MAEIRWTVEAEKWLKNIYDYIAQDDPRAAAKVVEGIYGKAQLLKEYPEIGYRYRSEPEGEIRILLYGHYRIAYLLAGNEVIDILGVFHGALEIDRYLPQKGTARHSSGHRKVALLDSVSGAPISGIPEASRGRC